MKQQHEQSGGGAMTPHKQRCETCSNWKGHYDVPFCKFWDEKIPITKYGMDLISHIGCASHSAAAEPVPDKEKEIVAAITDAFDRGYAVAMSDIEDMGKAKEQECVQRVQQERVLNDLWKFCLINGAEEHGDLIAYPSGDGFFALKLLNKIAEMRYESLRAVQP